MFNKLKIGQIHYLPMSALATVLASNVVYANDFLVTDFDFAMDCTPAGNPVFPDSNTTNREIPDCTDPDGAGPLLCDGLSTGPKGIFTDGVYAGSAPPTPADNPNFAQYVKFNFFGNFDSFVVANYTAQTGVDGGNHAPPTFDLVNLTADMGSFYANWNGTEFLQGNENVALVDNFDGSYTTDYLSAIVGGAFDGCTGRWKFVLKCTTCPTTTPGPNDTLTAAQGAVDPTSIISATGGPVTVTSSFGANPGGFNELSITSVTAPSLVDTDADPGEFAFDPSTLADGLYIFESSYEDGNVFPALRGAGSITLLVSSTATGDTGDDDGDGIINEFDDVGLAATQLQTVLGNNAAYIASSDAGQMVLGSIAFCSQNAAGISTANITAFGGSQCTAATNASDTLVKNAGIGGLFDFEVRGLALGGSTANIVLPLSAAIPPNAVYRLYNPGSGWTTFGRQGTDSLSSAPSTSAGVCPVPGSPVYTDGLTAGHDCVQLTMVDGGTNDTDGLENGIVRDPGGVAEIQSNVEAHLPSGCSISGTDTSIKHHMEWVLLGIFAFMIGIRRRITSLMK